MKTVLITGINGFLGSRLAIRLQAHYNVIGLGSGNKNLNRLPENRFKVYSATEPLEPIFTENEVYAVIHAATVYRRNDEPIEKLIRTNVLLPVELYDLSNKYNTKLFLNTDSFFNNPQFDYKYLVDYTLSKKHSIEWLKIMQQDKCHLINMKVFHMYGKNDGPGKFIPKLLSDIRSNMPVVNLTPGEQKRDFIYVEDAVSAYEIVLEQADSLASGFLEFHLGMGFSISIKDLALTMAEVTQSTSNLNFGAFDYRENEIMDSVADNKSLINLGWNPAFDLKAGLTELLQ